MLSEGKVFSFIFLDMGVNRCIILPSELFWLFWLFWLGEPFNIFEYLPGLKLPPCVHIEGEEEGCPKLGEAVEDPGDDALSITVPPVLGVAGFVGRRGVPVLGVAGFVGRRGVPGLGSCP